MVLFCKPNNEYISQMIIPMNRVINISAGGCRININYDGGEVMEVIEGHYQKKIDTVSIVYDSADDVDKAIRQFYKACSNNAGSFFFGSIKQ